MRHPVAKLTGLAGAPVSHRFLSRFRWALSAQLRCVMSIELPRAVCRSLMLLMIAGVTLRSDN